MKGDLESARLSGGQKSRGRKLMPARNLQAGRVHRKCPGIDRRGRQWMDEGLITQGPPGQGSGFILSVAGSP